MRGEAVVGDGALLAGSVLAGTGAAPTPPPMQAAAPAGAQGWAAFRDGFIEEWFRLEPAQRRL